jgi:predicted nuclease with RNAse H fold
VRSLGIDVGAKRKGLDAVLLDETKGLVDCRRHAGVDEIADMIEGFRPDVVAIDSPPDWGRSPGGSRLTEREIRRLGIQSFGTPSDPIKASNVFYDWMRAGFEVFEVAANAGFERYGAGPVRRKAIEVFPHASAVVLAGCLPPRSAGKGRAKREWRRGVLETHGVLTDDLRSSDQVDAALAALTGLCALAGQCFAPGDPREGVIVLPAASLPPPPYARCRDPERKGDDGQLVLRGLSRCVCGDPGCTASTSREFAPGHDAKRKSLLWRLARSGQDAADELRRRGWELPPEMG